MEKIRTGKLNPRALELPIEVQPIERAKRVTLKRLNYLLGFIEEKNPEAIQRYVANLQSWYNFLTKSDLVGTCDVDLESLLSDMPNLAAYPNVTKAYLEYYLELLDPKSPDWTKKVITVPNANYLKAYLYPRYYNLKVLTETMGRKEAIKAWKEYITTYIIYDRPQPNPPISAEELFTRRSSGREDSEWVIVYGIIADGKFAYKNENCPWVDAMEELPDREFKYLVCCYGDYQGAASRYENIVFTMEHTIAEGDPYCSRVMHDTRVDWVLDHPPKEFWDDFN